MTKKSGSPMPPISMLLRSLSWRGAVNRRSCQRKNTPNQSGLGASLQETLKFGVWGGASNHFSFLLLSRLFLPGRDSAFRQKRLVVSSYNCFYITCPDYFSRLRTPRRHAGGGLGTTAQTTRKTILQDTSAHDAGTDKPSVRQPTMSDSRITNAVCTTAQ